jgi:hypothetical protein
MTAGSCVEGFRMNVFEERRKRAQNLMAQNDVAAPQVTGRGNYFYSTRNG